jgi:hypothetical protein
MDVRWMYFEVPLSEYVNKIKFGYFSVFKWTLFIVNAEDVDDLLFGFIVIDNFWVEINEL